MPIILNAEMNPMRGKIEGMHRGGREDLWRQELAVQISLRANSLVRVELERKSDD